jgi:replicative DNA helicase
MVLIDKQMVVTPVTLKPYFETDPAMVELGGTRYLARLTADGQGLLAPRELAQQIYDLALLRELVSVGRELVEQALDTSRKSSRCGRSRRPRPRCSASPRAPRAAARPRASAAPRARRSR